LQLFWIEGKGCNGEALIYSFFIGTCCVQYPHKVAVNGGITESHAHKSPDDYQIRLAGFQRESSSPCRGSLLPEIWKRDSPYFRPEGDTRGEAVLPTGMPMRQQYDFSSSRKNPYAAKLKKPVTIRLDEESMSEETGIPYQSLINLYLKECAASGKRLNLSWK